MVQIEVVLPATPVFEMADSIIVKATAETKTSGQKYLPSDIPTETMIFDQSIVERCE